MPEKNKNRIGLKSESGLQQFVRSSASSAAAAAEQDARQGYFNAMSWMDQMLEDHPHMFDDFFDKAWHELSDDERVLRAAQIRKVL